ncbi:MAG: DUF1028 domain-containing protein [Chloroflexi bacterium]|nr:DUF1028 domain-containing protein [Chloroflexota bacterium]
MTFSIVAYDAAAKQWGVAVESKFLAAGAIVPYAKAGVGAVATQAHANTTYGPRGLALMAEGLPADVVVQALLANDPESDRRQAGLVDADGRAAAHTGARCLNWAGHITGEGYTCQGNILAGPDVVQAMARAYEAASGELAERLVTALQAGQDAGGDRRGQQGAGLLVVQVAGGYGGYNDRVIDLRVDEHATPIAELRRILALHRMYFGKPRPEDLLPIEGDLAREVQAILQRAGTYKGAVTGVYDAATHAALVELSSTENFEERQQLDAKIDRVVLDFLRGRFGS